MPASTYSAIGRLWAWPRDEVTTTPESHRSPRRRFEAPAGRWCTHLSFGARARRSSGNGKPMTIASASASSASLSSRVPRPPEPGRRYRSAVKSGHVSRISPSNQAGAMVRTIDGSTARSSSRMDSGSGMRERTERFMRGAWKLHVRCPGGSDPRRVRRACSAAGPLVKIRRTAAGTGAGARLLAPGGGRSRAGSSARAARLRRRPLPGNERRAQPPSSHRKGQRPKSVFAGELVFTSTSDSDSSP